MLKGERKKLRKISTAMASRARKRTVSTAASLAETGAGVGELSAVALASVMARHWRRIGLHVKQISADGAGMGAAAVLKRARHLQRITKGSPMTTAAQAWQALADWKPQKIADLVAADPDARLQAPVRSVADISIDFAQKNLDEESVALLPALATE